jgi:hypothetical protein
MIKSYKFKPGSKIVHNETKVVKRIIQINARTDEYMFKQEGTKTLEIVSQEEIESNYEKYKLENIWDKL